jgi:hypothetical protein
MIRWLLVASLLSLSATTGCDMRGCICHEALTIRRATQDGAEAKQLQLGHEQQGPGAVIDMKIPANMNASLCLC